MKFSIHVNGKTVNNQLEGSFNESEIHWDSIKSHAGGRVPHTKDGHITEQRKAGLGGIVLET